MKMIVARLKRSWSRYTNNKRIKIMIIVVIINYYLERGNIMF